MKWAIALVILGLASNAEYATAVEADVPVSKRALSPDSRVPAFGDSLTDGVGGSGENFPERLSRLIDRPVLNAGLPGDTTADGLRRLRAALKRDRPALLILCLGVNDLLQGIDPKVVHDNLLDLIRQSQSEGVFVLLVAVPQPGSRRAHPLYRKVAAASGAWLDEDAMVSVLSNPALKADLVHPNAEGHRVIAWGLAQRLRREGLIVSSGKRPG